MERVAWLLNLDAELELAGTEAPAARRRSTFTEQTSAFLASAQRGAEGRFIQHVAMPSVSPAVLADCRRQAWCATAAARRIADLPAGPGQSLLREVNHRAFAHEIGERAGARLAGSQFLESREAVEHHFATNEWPAEGWLCKRPLGFSGRWRKHLTSPPSVAEWLWIDASMKEYGTGLMLEPFLQIDQEFSLHGYLTRAGRTVVGQPTLLRCGPDGAWLGNELAGANLPDDESTVLRESFGLVTESLCRVGYSGPYSIDAFRYVDADGARHFRSLSELNARYSMGFFTGIGDRHAEWFACLAEE